VLDRIVGPGNSTVQVTADLDFDKSVSESTSYQTDPSLPPLSSSESSEKYAGPGGGGAVNGVVGPDGQMDPVAGGSDPSKYTKKQKTQDNPVGSVVEHRETAPGSVNSMHVAVAIDTASLQGRSSTTDIQDLISAGNGISTKRGDTIQVTSLQFDRTADEAAAAELAAAAKAEQQARMWRWARDAGIALAVVAMLLLAWLRSRKRSKARENATTYIVEQLRTDAAERAALAAAAEAQKAPAVAALERADHAANEELRNELSALVAKQPEDVAALLRGWLVDR